MSLLSSELVEKYINRQSAATQLEKPACLHLETMLILYLLRIAHGESAHIEDINTTIEVDQQVLKVTGKSIQKQKGLRSYLMLDGELAGFTVWTDGHVMRPLLERPMFFEDFAIGGGTAYQQFPEYDQLMSSSSIKKSGELWVALIPTLFEMLSSASISHDPKIMARNMKWFQEKYDSEKLVVS